MIEEKTGFVRGETLTTEEFIRRARNKHGDKYDYNDEYVSSKQKIKIQCKRHGIFLQNPADHLMGHGCKKCAKVKGLWCEAEDEIVQKYYVEKGAYFCLNLLPHKTEHAIRHRAQLLGSPTVDINLTKF